MTNTALVHHRWSRSEYERMAVAGVFAPEDRLELIDGEIWELTPQSSLHATAVRKAEEALRSVFEEGFDVRVQLPMALGPDSEPEPDVAVVPGHLEDYRDAHPCRAALVVEISDSSLDYDRSTKARLYAANDIGEYWIVNLVDSHIVIYRQSDGGEFRQQMMLGIGDSISPLANPDEEIAATDLLP